MMWSAPWAVARCLTAANTNPWFLPGGWNLPNAKTTFFEGSSLINCL